MPADALKPGAPQVWPSRPPAISATTGISAIRRAVDAAIAKAARVVKLDLVNNRLVPNAMEPRAAIGEFDRATNEYTLYTTSQNPHVIRLLMGAFVLHIPEARLRVVAPDVGGGFGSKIYHYAEEAIVTWAAGKVRKPVKWTAERSESFMSDAHGRDHVTHVELALDADAKFTALKVSTVANMGAYLSTFATCIPTYLYGDPARRHLHDPGDLCRDQGGVHQHRAGRCLSRRRPAGGDVPAGAHRRCRRRRIGDRPGRVAPAQLHPGRRLPVPDPGRAAIRQRRLPDDVARWRWRRPITPASRRGARKPPTAASIAASASPPISRPAASRRRRWSARWARAPGCSKSAAVRVHPTGSVTVLTGSHAHGQGHETTFAQLVADHLGVPIEQIEIVHGDTAKIPYGMGTYGSRSLAVGGSAIIKAMDKVVAKGRKIAAHLLEAAEADIEFKDGKFTRRRHRPRKDARRDRADRLCAAQFPA